MASQGSLDDAVAGMIGSQRTQGAMNFVKRIFDPIGITGDADTGAVDAAQAAWSTTRARPSNRADRERARLLSQLDIATTALQSAVDKLSSAVKEHYDQVAGVDRLRVHVKENILYYMQAIWRQEPPDQRYFRLYDHDVPDLAINAAGELASVTADRSAREGVYDTLIGKERVSATLPVPDYEVAQDEARRHRRSRQRPRLQGQLHGLRAQEEQLPDPAHDAGLPGTGSRSRPARSGRSRDLHRRRARLGWRNAASRTAPERWKAIKPDFKQLLIDRLSSPDLDGELVIVPTSSLYIECLVGTHPLLEDFKLIHRALDVKKVQAEVRHAELENIRLAARALEGEREDPDIEKKIVVEGAPTEPVVIDPDG